MKNSMHHHYSKNKRYQEPCNKQCSFCFLNYVDALHSSEIFKHLKPNEIGEIIRSIHHQVKTFQKDEVIASSGEPCSSLRLIVKGAAIGEMMDFQGRTLRIEKLSAPDSIASAFIFGDNSIFPVDVIAVEETKMLIIPKQDLMSLFSRNETILKNYLDIISNRAQNLTRKIKVLGLQSIRGKLAHYLLNQAREVGSTEFKLKASQNDLANMFGITRPSLARVIREIHNEGIIRAKGKQISIINKQALKELLR